MIRPLVLDNLHFVRSNLRWVGGGFLLMFFSTFGQTYFVGLSGPYLMARYGLTGGQFGGLYMVATMASALTLPWLGRSLDFLPAWKVVRFSIPGLAVGCVLIVTAPHVAVLLVALYMLRLFGQGMLIEIAYTEVGRWFSSSRGRAMAVVTLGLQAGAALLPLAFALTERQYGWRLPWIAAALMLMLVGFPATLRLLSVDRVPHSIEPQPTTQHAARDWTSREVLRDPMLYLLLAGTLAPPFIATVIYFHQGTLVALRGYDRLAFVAAFPVMAVTTVLSGLLCGHLIDRFGALRLLPFLLIPLAIALATMALVVPLWGVYVFMLLLGISNGLGQTLLGALWPEVYGLANLGGIRAIVVSAWVMATALGPGVSGVLIDHGVALPTQMLWMALWCAAASLALAAASRVVRYREAGSCRSAGAIDIEPLR